MNDAWNPTIYNRFATQRTQPFHDLLDLVEAADAVDAVDAVDLGCGTGELSRIAATRFGCQSLLGIDSSASMLADATRFADDVVRFEQGDISEFAPLADFDLVIANASLQWVPNHAAVLAQWRGALRPGGQMAVQVPANAYMPSHRVADELAHSPQFIDSFGPQGPPPDPVARNVLEPEQYALLLHDLGFTNQHVRLQIYPHLLDRSRDVVTWVRGTTLTRFEQRLDPATFADFVAEYERHLIDVIGDSSPYFFPFRRILIWGRLPN